MWGKDDDKGSYTRAFSVIEREQLGLLVCENIIESNVNTNLGEAGDDKQVKYSNIELVYWLLTGSARSKKKIIRGSNMSKSIGIRNTYVYIFITSMRMTTKWNVVYPQVPLLPYELFQ